MADDERIDAPVADPNAWAERALGGAAAWGAGAAFGVGGGLQAAASTIGDVITELQSFTKFRDRIDALLRDLQESAAGPKEVGQGVVSRAKFGGGSGGWIEATNLFDSYETVHSELEKLSKLLTDSIEGLSIAVLASHKGYENVDADVRQRMLAISKGTSEHYGGSYEPQVPGAPGGATTKPGGVEQKKLAAAKKPDGAQPKKPEAAKKPVGVKEKKPEAAKKPDGAEQKKHDAAKKPDRAQPKKPEAVKKPGGAQPKKPEAVKKPVGIKEKKPDAAKKPDGAEQKKPEFVKKPSAKPSNKAPKKE